MFRFVVLVLFVFFFFVKQKTAYEMRISDWSSDVCSSDLPGMGVTLDGNWQSGFRVRAPAGSGQQDYRHRPVTTLNLHLFAEPERLLRMQETPAWLSDLNISLDVRNLFNAYRRVMLDDGSVPAGYRRYDVDPLGRTVQLSVRKRF